MVILSCWRLGLALCIGVLLGLATSASVEAHSLEQLLAAMDEATRNYSATTKAASAVEIDQARREGIEENRKELVARACELTLQLEEHLWQRHLLSADLEKEHLDDAEAAVKAFLDSRQLSLVELSMFGSVVRNKSFYYLHQFPTRIAVLRGRRNPPTLPADYARVLLEGRSAASRLMELLQDVGYWTANLWCPTYGKKMDPQAYQTGDILKRQADLQAELASCFNQYMRCAERVVDEYDYEAVAGNGVFIIAQDIVLEPWSYFRYLIGHPDMTQFSCAHREADHYKAFRERLHLATVIGGDAFNKARRLAGDLLNKVPLLGQDWATCLSEPFYVAGIGECTCLDEIAIPFPKLSASPRTILSFRYHLNDSAAKWVLNENYSYKALRAGFLLYRHRFHTYQEDHAEFFAVEMNKHGNLLQEIEIAARNEKFDETQGGRERAQVKRARLACAAASFLHIFVLNDIREAETTLANDLWKCFVNSFGSAAGFIIQVLLCPLGLACLPCLACVCIGGCRCKAIDPLTEEETGLLQ